MNEYSVTIPLFKYSDIERGGYAESAMVSEQLNAAIHSFESRFDENEGYCLVFIKKPIDNDYQYGLACCPIKDIDALHITVPNMELPLITIGVSTDISKALSKIINNKAFL